MVPEGCRGWYYKPFPIYLVGTILFSAYEKYNPKYAFLTVQQSGPIEEKIEQYAKLYVRGMNELKDYLEEI